MFITKKVLQSGVLALTLCGLTAVYAADSISTTGNKASAVASVTTPAVVNINTANEEQLMAVKGLGEKKAKAIIEYREQNGKFKSVDDIAQVKGISEKTLTKFKEQLTVG